MLAEMLSEETGEVGSRPGTRLCARGLPASLRAEGEPQTGSAARTDLGSTSPGFMEVIRGFSQMMRDVEAMRYVMHNLVTDDEMNLGVRLIQKRYRFSARRARQILGLPVRPEGSP